MLRRRRAVGESSRSEVVVPFTSACRNCGGSLETGDVFCAACGAAVAAPGGTPTPVLPTEEVSAGDDRRRLLPRWARIVLVVIALALVAAAIAFFASAWSGERADRRATEAELATARGQVAELETDNGELRADLADVQAELGAAEALVNTQELLLGQTEKVLGRVDPLLSSVDELKLLAAQIQDDRDAFRLEAEALRNELVDFANYLIGTSPFDYDSVYLNGTIDYLNVLLGSFAATGESLDDRDQAYARASQRFDNRANRYSEAVRRLERALGEASD